MNLNEVKEALANRDFLRMRSLLREFENLVVAQTPPPPDNSQSAVDFMALARAAQQLATAIRKRANNGEDNRIDVIALEARRDSVLSGIVSRTDNCRAVAMLTERSMLKEQKEKDSWKLTTASFGDALKLCPQESFFRRPMATPSTAFLVREDLVVTLRHNLSLFSGLDEICVIFDFQMQVPGDEDSCKVVFSRQEIYGVTERYSLVDDDRNAFVALRLTRPVEGRAPVVCNFGSPIVADKPVYMIGHPWGLPKLFADNAMVLDATSAKAFTASLDAFAGNSGSPVFNAETGQVEGILAEGEEDFCAIPNGSGGFCRVTIVHQAEPFGYKVMRIKKLQQLLEA